MKLQIVKKFQEGTDPVILYQYENKKPVFDPKRIGLLTLLFSGTESRRLGDLYYAGELEIAKLGELRYSKDKKELYDAAIEAAQSEETLRRGIIIDNSFPFIIGSFDNENYVNNISLAYLKPRENNNIPFTLEWLGNIEIINYKLFVDDPKLSSGWRNVAREQFKFLDKELRERGVWR